MKKLFYISSLLLVYLTLTFSVSAQAEQEFTLNELSKYNGKDGAKAYVAVNGVVYDVTNIPGWPQGKHFCPGALAGKDITGLWSKVPASHQNPDFLRKFPVVGKLASKPAETPPPTAQKAKEPQKSQAQPNTPNKPSRSNASLWLGLAALITAGVWFILRSRRKDDK